MVTYLVFIAWVNKLCSYINEINQLVHHKNHNVNTWPLSNFWICRRRAIVRMAWITRFHDYCPQTKFAKVMFLHLCVSHSVHRGGICVGWGLHPEGSASMGVCIRRGWADPPHWVLRDTINERAVRILLECILVETILDKQSHSMLSVVKFDLMQFT